MQFDQVMFGVHEHPKTKFEKYYLFLHKLGWFQESLQQLSIGKKN